MKKRTRRKIVPVLQWTFGTALLVYVGLDMIRLSSVEPIVAWPWLRTPGMIVGCLGVMMFVSVWCYGVFTRRGRIELTRDSRRP